MIFLNFGGNFLIIKLSLKNVTHSLSRGKENFIQKENIQSIRVRVAAVLAVSTEKSAYKKSAKC